MNPKKSPMFMICVIYKMSSITERTYSIQETGRWLNKHFIILSYLHIIMIHL